GIFLIDPLTQRVIGAAIELHRNLGPGLLESLYEACLAFELRAAGLKVETQKPLPVRYRGMVFDASYRLDLLIEDRLIVEVKSVEQIARVHKAQLLSYLKLSACDTGLLLNFNVPVLREGIERIVLNRAD